MTISIKPTASGSTIEQDGSTVLSIESDRSVDVDSGTLHVDATNNHVGIGTTTPSSISKLHVYGTGGTRIRLEDTTGFTSLDMVAADTQPNVINFGDASDINIGRMEYDHSTNSMHFDTNNAERMRIDSSGNVGIGTSSPSSQLYLNKGGVSSSDQGPEIILARDSLSGASLTVDDPLNTLKFQTNTANRYWAIQQKSGNTTTTSSLAFVFGTDGPAVYERMRIDSLGNVLIGTTTNGGAGGLSIDPDADDGAPMVVFNRNSTTANSNVVRFRNGGVESGKIFYNNNSTGYVTSSDYRLKENVSPMSGSIDRLKQLKPSTWAWVQDGSHGEGFLAHEAQTVVPASVTGTKDAMRTEEYEVTPAVEATYDEEDNELTPAVEAVMGTREVPDYQGIDQSKLVPLLTAALQEAITKIEDLETRIEALESN